MVVDRAREGIRDDQQQKCRVTKWLVGVGAVVVLAGLLFGYDQGVVSDALTGRGSSEISP